jgi:hypothetical protein
MSGRRVKSFFTIVRTVRYGWIMLLLALTALAAAPTSPPMFARATSQAQAMIRVVTSVKLRVGAEQSEQGHPLRSVTIPADDGQRVPAKLVEFE